ncbi:hypothetical protein [Bdellovibrio sp. GT3]|uniref:hypothetical protein n=1 Tax=Bdellovibrio sp. GT3 TaxID=3136282 RepID=UPI0030F0B4FC
MIYKLIGTLVILAAGVLAFLIVQDNPSANFIKVVSKSQEACIQLTPAQQLVKLINDDIDGLKRTNQLPKEWNSIATIEYLVRSDLARTLLGSEKLSLQRVKEGNYYLEVEVLDLPDEKDPGIILQMSLKEIKSKNKIYEIGRTYLMSTLNRQTIPAENPKQQQQQTNQATPSPTANTVPAQPQTPAPTPTAAEKK